MNDEPGAEHITIAGGSLLLASDGTPLQVSAAASPAVRYLLDPLTEGWHTSEHRWGSGFLVTSAGSGRWNRPVLQERPGPRTWRCVHRPVPGLEVEVQREALERFRETIRIRNTSTATVEISTLGMSVPVRDVYTSAEDALRSAVHAHIWPGGSHGYLVAQPMGGDGAVLSLLLERGMLQAYSIESRSHTTGSNVRGHIILHAVDSRAPHAFGGQRRLCVPAGQAFELVWSLGLHETMARATAQLAPPWRAESYVVASGQAWSATGIETAEINAPSHVEVQRCGDRVEIRADRHGLVDLEIGDARTAVLFAGDIEGLVRARVRYILDHQRATERAGTDAAALVPVDTRTRLTRLTSGWPDWSDGAERVAMPSLMQQARLRGWGTPEIDEALDGWSQFARRRLLDHQATPRWGSDTTVASPRLYNSPWLAHFFADQYVLYRGAEDLELAVQILERSVELGSQRHLSIGMPEAMLHVAGLLVERGEAGRAKRLVKSLEYSAQYFAEIGSALPEHEVNYEQSMVAPLVTLLSAGYRLTHSEVYELPLRRAVAWLTAFGGPQPHALLRNVGIRHWDGYWFGELRLWGDTFPHHWSALSSVALGQLPQAMRTADTQRATLDGFLANLHLFAEDGSASAAFIMPSAIDGRPAHVHDPLANDQDWALVLYLRHLASAGGWPVRAPFEILSEAPQAAGPPAESGVRSSGNDSPGIGDSSNNRGG
ncbi:MAG: hypothetical protein ACK5KO_03675 [Arachnia sp.]